MRLVLACATCLIAVVGCASVASNDGEKVVVQWDPSLTSRDGAFEAAIASCREVGKTKAIEIVSVQAAPQVPSWMSQRRTTYRCEEDVPSAITRSSSPQAVQPQTPQRPSSPPAPIGQDAFYAEKIAREARCTASKPATLAAKGAGFETYSFMCDNGDALIVRCEMGNCRVMN